MPKKQPLYPHVPKGRKKGTGAFRCKECGYTAWNVIRCPKCGSYNLEELTPEEVMSHYETGKPEIHRQAAYPLEEGEAETEERLFYYCSIEEKHPNREIIQISTTQRNPKCPYCGGIMTYGKWWPVKRAEE